MKWRDIRGTMKIFGCPSNHNPSASVSSAWVSRPATRGADDRLALSGQKPYIALPMEHLTSAKTRRIEIRMTDEERDLEQAAAATRGQTLSEFVRQAARREAEQVLAERTSIALSPEEAGRFLATLDDPASFEAGLGALTERPSVLGG
jgi:uncharacterized protein (DUF1778 family)